MVILLILAKEPSPKGKVLFVPYAVQLLVSSFQVVLAKLRKFQGLLYNIFCFLSLEKRANQGRHLYHSESRVKQLIDSEQFKEEDKKDIDVPFFDFEDILAATDNFSDANKLGRGGFGPVYKEMFLISMFLSFSTDFSLPIYAYAYLLWHTGQVPRRARNCDQETL